MVKRQDSDYSGVGGGKQKIIITTWFACEEYAQESEISKLERSVSNRTRSSLRILKFLPASKSKSLQLQILLRNL